LDVEIPFRNHESSGEKITNYYYGILKQKRSPNLEKLLLIFVTTHRAQRARERERKLFSNRHNLTDSADAVEAHEFSKKTTTMNRLGVVLPGPSGTVDEVDEGSLSLLPSTGLQTTVRVNEEEG
jgi:hypothetical protein